MNPGAFWNIHPGIARFYFCGLATLARLPRSGGQSDGLDAKRSNFGADHFAGDN